MAESNNTIGFWTILAIVFGGAILTRGTLWDREEVRQRDARIERARERDRKRVERMEREDPTGEKRRQKHNLEMTMQTLGELSQYWRKMQQGDISNRDWAVEYNVYLNFCGKAGRDDQLCRKMAFTQMVKDGIPMTTRLATTLGLDI